jgi:hypothetical protein
MFYVLFSGIQIPSSKVYFERNDVLNVVALVKTVNKRNLRPAQTY